MKFNISTLKQQAQDLVLRLFVEGHQSTPSGYQYYTGARCGTFSRCH